MVFSLIYPLRLDTKTESESTNRMDISNLPRWCTAYHAGGVPGGIAYLVGNEKSFCRGRIEDDQCLGM
jgi:hypothetical protein